MRNRNTKWTLVVILAAFVAALTTIAVFFLRARARKKAITAYDDSIDYDFDDCCGEMEDEENDECETGEKESPVQIPLAKPEDEPPAVEE